MNIEVSRETETRLIEQARRQDISVDVLLERLMSEQTSTTHFAGVSTELPVWHLGEIGPLHRRQIYEDVG